MTQTIQAVVSAAQLAVKNGISKIQSAPAYASDVKVSVPTSLALATNIKMSLESAGFKLTWFDLIIDIMVPKTYETTAMSWLSTLPQEIGDIFRDDITIGGTCQTYEGDVMAVFVRDKDNAVVGYEFTVQQVKLEG
jgi:hypothetical protein